MGRQQPSRPPVQTRRWAETRDPEGIVRRHLLDENGRLACTGSRAGIDRIFAKTIPETVNCGGCVHTLYATGGRRRGE